MPIEMIPAEPTAREVLADALRIMEEDKARLERILEIESQDGVAPTDAEDIRSEIRELSDRIASVRNQIEVLDGTRMPDHKEGQGEMLP